MATVVVAELGQYASCDHSVFYFYDSLYNEYGGKWVGGYVVV